MPGEDRIYTIKFGQLSDEHDDELIGLNAKLIYKLNNLEINSSDGFVITTQAFDDFVVANDIPAQIIKLFPTLNPQDFKSFTNVQQSIKNIFKDAVLPPSLLEEINVAYEHISKLNNYVVSVQPSLSENLYRFNGNAKSKYTFTEISNIEDLITLIKQSWLALFDANAMYERYENNIQDRLTIALVVKRLFNTETSGRASSYNPINDKSDEIEIEAVLGLWKGIDEIDLVPDHYIVNKSTELIIEKNVLPQQDMLMRKGFFKPGDKIDLKIPISKHWQARQKLSDSLIGQLTILIKNLETELASRIDIEWGIETGRIYITNINTVKGKFRPVDEIINKVADDNSTSQKQEKTIDEYVTEIEKEMEALSSDSDATDISDDLDIADLIVNQPEADKVEESVHDASLPLRIALWDKHRFAAEGKANTTTVTNIWLDIEKPTNADSINSNEFEGVLGIRGEDLYEGFGLALANANEDIVTQLKEYMREQLLKFAGQDFNNYIIYSLSNLDSEQASRYISLKHSGLALHLNHPNFSSYELDTIKYVRSQHNYRKLWLGVRGITQVKELREVKKMLVNAGLKRTSTFKLFFEIDKVPPLLSIDDFLLEGFEGIVLYLDNVINDMFGSKINYDLILNNDLFWEMLKNLSTQASKKNIQLIIKTTLLNKNEEFLLKLLKTGINGIGVGGKEFNEIKRLIQKLELQILSRS